MALVAQFAPAWDGASRAQFVPAWIEDAVPLVLVTDIDAGNVSQSLSTVSDPTSAAPVISLAHRSDAGSWRHLLFALDGAAGKRPVFKAPRSTRYTNTDPTADYRPVWTHDFKTWVRAPSRQLVGGASGTIEWQFTDPFPDGRVYIATQPLGRQIDATYLAEELLADYSSVCSPISSANAQGVFFTSPAENDGTGRAVGAHPLYGLRLRFGGVTNDGGPKRRLVMIAGIHAAGEATSWLPFVNCLRWMLDSASAEAVAFRANWDVDLYYNITPNGLYGGNNRRNFRGASDPNRIWDNPDAQIAATQSAILSEIAGGRFDAFYSWHAWSSASSPFLCYVTPSQANVGTRTAVMQAMIDTATAIFGTSASITSSGTYNTDVWWAEQQGCPVAFDTEVQQNGSTDPAIYQAIGESWAKTLQAVDAAGWFAGPAIELSAISVSASSATSSLTTTIRMAGASASLSLADGDLSTAIRLRGHGLSASSATAVLSGPSAGLVGMCLCGCLAIGSLGTEIRLSGVGASQSDVWADLKSASVGLLGAAQSVSMGLGELRTGIRLAVTARSQSAARAALVGGEPALPPPWRVLRLRYPSRILRLRP